MNGALVQQYKWHITALLVGIVLGIVGSYMLGLVRTHQTVTERIIEREVPVVRETVKQETQTELVYVPKTIITEQYKNPSTGALETKQSKEKTDVAVQVEKPVVSVKVNGQYYAFSLLEAETQKFDKGKISLQQQSTIGVDLAIKPHVIDRSKTVGIDLFVGKYSGIGIQYHRLGLDVGTNGKDQDYRLRWRAVEW